MLPPFPDARQRAVPALFPLLCLLSAFWALPALAGETKPLPFATLFGGPFELVDHHGAVRRDSDFHGQFVLVSFGYTHCPDICPTTLQLVTEAMDLLGDAGARVQPIFVSIDPARDDVASLASYMAHFHPRLLGLTGSEAQVRAAAKVYKLHRRKVILPDAGGPDDYLVDHGSMLYLMGPDGGFVTLFHFRQANAETVAATIARYLADARS